MPTPSIVQTFGGFFNGYGSSTTATASGSVTAGNLLLVFATDYGPGNGNGSDVPTDTLSTGYGSFVASPESNAARVRLFTGIASGSGACVVSSTWAGGNVSPSLFVVEVSNALITPNGIASFVAPSGVYVNDFTSSGLTTTNPNTLLIACAAADRDITAPGYTAGPGYTILNPVIATGNAGAEYQILTSTLSNVPQIITSTDASPNYAMVVVALESAGGGGGGGAGPFLIHSKLAGGGSQMRSLPGKYPIRIY